MAFIKLEADNVTRYVDEANIRKIEKLKKSFFVEPELDEYGQIKRYTVDEVAEKLGKGNKNKDINSIFNIKPNITKTTKLNKINKDTTNTNTQNKNIKK